jgi:tRNA-Thr(GGU) m(6)t(6)A37 methyltransferase TsaA
MEPWQLLITYGPIGVIYTPHTDPAKTPVQPRYARGTEGRIEVDARFADGLSDLEGFSHIVLLFHLHRAKTARLKVVPFLHDVRRGIFSTRSPSRPNPIGLSVVCFVRREGCTLHVCDVDMLDGSLLLDIKPHIARFGVDGPARSRWHESIDEAEAKRRGCRCD